MKQNSQLHITLDSEFLNFLRKEAQDNNICLAELCRRKLRENSKLERIEVMLKEVLDKNGN